MRSSLAEMFLAMQTSDPMQNKHRCTFYHEKHNFTQGFNTNFENTGFKPLPESLLHKKRDINRRNGNMRS